MYIGKGCNLAYVLLDVRGDTYEWMRKRIDRVDMPTVWKITDESLPKREAQILHLLFDGQGNHTGMSLRNVGKMIGVSGGRVQQIRDRTLRRLRHPYRVRRYAPLPEDAP